MKKLLALLLGVCCLGIFAGCEDAPTTTAAPRVVEVDSVILSTNSCDVVEGETFSLSYQVIPENADLSNYVWKSVDENVATVDANGTISAHNVGQTTVYFTNGEKTFASCTINVMRKAAYDLLSDAERDFVDTVLKDINYFKNPNAVKIHKVSYSKSNGYECWFVEISSTNSYGGTIKEIYVLERSGFMKNPYILVAIHDEDYRLDLINEAIDDRR